MIKLEAKGKESSALRDKPDIRGSEWIWEGFSELNTCRQVGMGAAPIPWTALRFYANENQIDGDDLERFEYCIRYMDNVFLEKVK